MKENPPSPPLRVVVGPSATPPPPELNLGEAGKRLWISIEAEYDVSDVGGRELLAQAAGAADRLEKIKGRIADDGELLRTKSGYRAHPLLSHEVAVRSFIVRTLMKLGINYEPIRDRPGRPPGR